MRTNDSKIERAILEVLIDPVQRRLTLVRFMESVEKTDGCWTWTGGGDGQGYGVFGVRKVPVRTHVFSYRVHVGPIPEGLVLDHLCRNRRCCRPDHLEPVTIRENFERAPGNHTKTHCPKGHPYEGENVQHQKNGSRKCATCNREQVARWRSVPGNREKARKATAAWKARKRGEA